MIRENEFESGVQKAWATYALVALNTLAFLATQTQMSSALSLNEKLLELGALHPLLLWKGEIWRFISAIFLHGSFFHYAFNTFVLLQIGRLFEPLIGSARLLLLFFITGAAGFALSVLTYSQFSIGSSGAVFGLIGGMLGSLLNLPKTRIDPKLLRTLTFFVILNLTFGLVVNSLLPGAGRVDNSSHIGGLIFGVMFGYAFVTETSFFQASAANFKARRQRLGTFMLVAALVGFFGIIGVAIKPVFLAQYHEMMAFDAITSNHLEEAELHAKWLEKSAKEKVNSKIIFSRLSAHRNEDEKAYGLARKALNEWSSDIESFWAAAIFERKSVLDLQSALFADEKGNSVLCKAMIDAGADRTEILNDCAWLFLMARDKKVQDSKKGLEVALRAAKTGDQVPAAVFHTLAEAYIQNGKMNEAIQAIDRGIIRGDKTSERELIEQKQRVQTRLDKDSKESPN